MLGVPLERDAPFMAIGLPPQRLIAIRTNAKQTAKPTAGILPNHVPKTKLSIIIFEFHLAPNGSF